MRNQEESFLSTPLSSAVAGLEAADGRMIGDADEISWHADTQSSRIGYHKRQENIPIRSLVTQRPIFSPAQALSNPHQAPRRGLEQWKAESDHLTEPRLQSKSTRTPPSVSRQYKLASDVLKLLQDNAAPDAVGAATARFFDAFEESLSIDSSSIAQELIDAAAQLSRASLAEKDFDTAERILRTILDHGNVDMEIFLSFNPEAIMRGLISKRPSQDSDSLDLYKANLRRACLLYLTRFNRTPQNISRELLDFGTKLCKQAHRYKLFGLVDGLYWRVARYSKDTPLPLVKYLIIAAHKEEQHSKTLRYFKRFYIKTSPDQLEFHKVLHVILEGLFKSDKYHLCEEFLESAALMAERERILMSSTLILKVLGNDWRTHRNIARTRALFHRLQPHFHLIGHPDAVYGAIIQFCVEAGDEETAATYYAQLTKLHHLGSADIRIRGHFTLAKAMRNDWSGVRDGLNEMQQLKPDRDDFSASFTPILKLFAQSHNVNQTEDFLRSFIQEYGGLLTPYLSNIMISKYLKAGELDSVSRWLDYMAAVNCKVDPSFFNIVLANCYHKFKLPYEEVYQIYKSVAKLNSRANQFINSDSLSTLRDIAVSSAGQSLGKGVKRLQILRLQVPMRTSCTRQIQAAMTVALVDGAFDRALKIYQRALDDQISVSEPVVTLAFRATLKRNPNDIDAAIHFLQDAQQAGQSVEHATSLLFVHVVSGIKHGNEAKSGMIRDIAQNIISSLESCGIRTPLSVMVQAMNILVQETHYREAIEFWNAMSHREGHPPIPVNIQTLTTILRAYTGLKDPLGVEWVMETVRADKINPDRRFKEALVKAHRSSRKLVAPHFVRSLVKALETVNELLENVNQDKALARMNALQIMEAATQTEATRYTETPVVWKPVTKLRSPDFNLEGPTDVCASSNEILKYNIDRRPQATLAGVVAG